jgi:hypothetical protein
MFSSGNARASFPLSLFPVRAAYFNIGLRFLDLSFPAVLSAHRIPTQLLF